MQPTTELPQTFWAKVEKTDTHWLWTGAHQSRGYGSFAIAGKTYQAHRLAYETAYGPIPDGLTIDHLCRVPSCVNPEHLEAVSLAENNRRGAAAQWATGFCRMGASINLSTARADLIECGLEAIVARLQLEIAELERWSRAYADTLARNAVGNGSELLSLAFDIGDPLIELQSIKRVLQTKADSALSPGESA